MRPQVKVERLEMEDPTFDGGVAKVAKAMMSNPTTKELTYTAELYLGVTKAATSGAGQVTIPAGGSQEVQFGITTPLVEGEYWPFLDIWCEGVLLKHYQATELVTIAVVPAIVVGPITWA